jgi:N-dimethylarginine dimethylaminohydrolase
MPFLIKNYPMFLMSPPFGMSAGSPNNKFMQEMAPHERQVNIEKAFRQWIEPYHLLAVNSLVPLLGQGGWLQDQSYVANLGIVLSHLDEMPIVISNYTAEERVGESLVGRLFFETLEAGPVLTCPFPFEGEADLKRITRNVYAMGIGMRTSAQAAVWFSRQFGMQVIPIQMRNEYAYHLDCVLFPIDSQKMLTAVTEILPEELRELEKYTEIVPVPERLVMPGATNLVRCGRLLLSASKLWALERGDDQYQIEKEKVDFLTKVAADNRLEPCFFNLSEFEKSGAALSCLVMHLTRPEFADQ